MIFFDKIALFCLRMNLFGLLVLLFVYIKCIKGGLE